MIKKLLKILLLKILFYKNIHNFILSFIKKISQPFFFLRNVTKTHVLHPLFIF